jgi:hypothetical protein
MDLPLPPLQHYDDSPSSGSDHSGPSTGTMALCAVPLILLVIFIIAIW